MCRILGLALWDSVQLVFRIRPDLVSFEECVTRFALIGTRVKTWTTLLDDYFTRAVWQGKQPQLTILVRNSFQFKSQPRFVCCMPFGWNSALLPHYSGWRGATISKFRTVLWVFGGSVSISGTMVSAVTWDLAKWGNPHRSHLSSTLGVILGKFLVWPPKRSSFMFPSFQWVYNLLSGYDRFWLFHHAPFRSCKKFSC